MFKVEYEFGEYFKTVRGKWELQMQNTILQKVYEHRACISKIILDGYYLSIEFPAKEEMWQSIRY